MQSDSFWICDEIYIEPGTESEKLSSFLTENFKSLTAIKKDEIIAKYDSNALTQKPGITNLSDAYKKIYELEERIKKLESSK